MTAPVEQQAKQKIEMTTPVTQQDRNGAWIVRFIMPKIWTMGTLPTPTDDRIKLLPEPAKQMVVITFSGTASDALIASKTAELKEYAAAAKLPIAGTPILAFYNPPWTLPMFRRNETMLEINTPR